MKSFLLIGAGNFGHLLARELSKQPCELMIADVSEHAFEKHDYLGKGCRLINSGEFDGLTVEEGTPLARRVSEGLTLPDDDAQADMYLYTCETLSRYGFRQ